MKNLLISALILVISASPSFASGKRVSVSVNPFGLMLGIIGAEGNAAVSDSISIPLAFSYFGNAAMDMANADSDFSVFQLTTGGRHYWQRKALKGWYLSGLISYNAASIRSTPVIIKESQPQAL